MAITPASDEFLGRFTTFVRDGALHFASDLYDRDDALVRSVAGAAMPDAGALREVEALRDLVQALISG